MNPNSQKYMLLKGQLLPFFISFCCFFITARHLLYTFLYAFIFDDLTREYSSESKSSLIDAFCSLFSFSSSLALSVITLRITDFVFSIRPMLEAGELSSELSEFDELCYRERHSSGDCAGDAASLRDSFLFWSYMSICVGL